jgi:hypothetical protein
MARDNTMRFTFSNVTAVYSVNVPNTSTSITALTPATAPANNTPVYFTAIATTGLVAQNVYYVVGASGATFGLAPTVGGTAVTLSGTATNPATMYIGNLSNVSTSLGGRSGVIQANRISNQWAVAYSDALNVGRFRDQQADQSQIATINSVVSSITGDPAVFGSTAEGSYFLRASVQVAGMFGPNPCQIIVQGNYDAGTGVAAGQTDNNWLPVSSIGNCAPNATGITFTSGTTSNHIGSGFIGTTPTVGSMFLATGGGAGIAIGTPYLVTAGTGGAFSLATTAGAVPTTTSTFVSGLVGGGGGGRAINLLTTTPTGNFIYADVVPAPGDAVVFTALSVTGGSISANTVYFVNALNGLGGFSVSATFGGASVTAPTAVASGTGITYGYDRLPIIQTSSTVTSGVFTTQTLAGGAVVPHGLQVGSLVVLQSGSSLTAIAVDTAYYVNSVPSATTFTLSATYNGATITNAAVSSGIWAVARSPKIVNVQIGRTARQYLRAALVQQNASVPSSGYFMFNYADLSVGKDSAQVA